MSFTVQKVQELSFSFRLQAQCIVQKKKKNMRRLFDKKEMNSMCGKLKENTHVRPTQTWNVAIN